MNNGTVIKTSHGLYVALEKTSDGIPMGYAYCKDKKDAHVFYNSKEAERIALKMDNKGYVLESIKP